MKRFNDALNKKAYSKCFGRPSQRLCVYCRCFQMIYRIKLFSGDLNSNLSLEQKASTLTTSMAPDSKCFKGPFPACFSFYFLLLRQLLHDLRAPSVRIIKLFLTIPTLLQYFHRKDQNSFPSKQKVSQLTTRPPPQPSKEF